MEVLRCLLALGYFFVFVVRNSEEASPNGLNDLHSGGDILTARLSRDDAEKHMRVILTKGDRVRLECVFPAKPWLVVQWLVVDTANGYKHAVIPANQTYSNENVTVSSIVLGEVTGEDAGFYNCVGANVVGATILKFEIAIKDETYCDEDLCGRYGTCSELLEGYLCKCEAGYIGVHCELQDPCIENPCLNNGSCLTTDNGFNCTCADGFKGEICNEEHCVPSTCNNAGSCYGADDGNLKCACRNNRAGERCEHTCTFTPYARGSHHSCYSGKTCVIGADGVERCQCQGRGGNHCMMESDVRDECNDRNICNGRGACREYTYKYKCDCRSYASGTNCEFYDECRSNNNVCSRYGGRCVNLPVGYNCTNCPPGQHGDKCQYKDNPCQVTCQLSYMKVKCDMRFLNQNLQSVPINLNSRSSNCLFNRNDNSYFYHNGYQIRREERTKTIYYNSCGTQVEYEEDYIVYRNSLRSGVPNSTEDQDDVITRVTGYFLFDMECRIPLLRNATSRPLQDLSLKVNETTHLKAQRNIVIPTQITFNNEYWRSISNYVVGNRLFVKMTLQGVSSNDLLYRYGVMIPAICFATADSAGKGPRHVLLQDGCMKDKTVRFEKGPSRDSGPRFYFSFDSFSFKSNPDKLYLHCDARLCLNHTGYSNVTDERICDTSCVDDEDVNGTTISLNHDVDETTVDVKFRRKRSLFEKVLGVRNENVMISRKSGVFVELLEGRAFTL